MTPLLFACALVVADAPAASDPTAAAAPIKESAPAVAEVPLSAAPATADGPLTVAVLDLKASGDVAGIAKALTTLVTNEVGQRPGFKAVSRNELKALLAHQSDARLMGCEEPQCLADVGKLANARRVIGGSVEHAEGDAVVFALTLIDPEGPVILDRIAWTWRSSVDDMVDLARPAVDRLLNGKQAESFVGDVEILAPDGAAVILDDKELGAAPLKPTRGLAIGVHHVEVRKDGYLPFSKDVAVSQGESHVLQVDLVDEASLRPWYARWYVWGSAIAGVVLVGGAVAAVGTYNYLQTPSTLVVGGPK
jgi:hypothetical protein